jgi:hypothetical protein
MRSTNEPAAADASRLGAAGIASVVVVAVIFVAHALYYWPQINDDAFITFRYSKFLSLGRGPYYNVGEHVEGYSNPSMMLLMAGVDAALGDAWVPFASKALGILSGLATLVFTGLLCSAWLPKIASLPRRVSLLAWLAPGLLATQSGFALNSTTGLETTLFSACIAGGLWLAQEGEDRDRWRGSGALFALGVLTRPEGLPVFAAAWTGRLAGLGWRDARSRRRLLLDGGVVTGVAAVLLAFRWIAYDGDLLPNTYFAKAGGMTGQVTAAAYLAGFARKHLAYVAWAPPLLVLATRRSSVLRNALPALFVLGFAVASIFLAGPDWMPGYRLLAPYLPAWAALSVLGPVSLLSGRSGIGRTASAAAACGAVLVTLLVWQGPVRDKYHQDCLQRSRGYAEGHEALAQWLQGRTKPGETVALMDIGIVGFRCIDLRVLDLTGLTDRHIARSPGSFLDKRFDPAYLFDRRPEYLVIVLTGRLESGSNDPAALSPWSPIERRVVAAPEFRRIYFRPRGAPEGAPPLDALAARVGAERVFRHEYPGRTYFLCVYVRRDPDRERPI